MADDDPGDESCCSSGSSSSSPTGEHPAIRTEEEEEEDEDEDEDPENINPLTTLLLVARSPKFHDGEMVIRSLHETLQYVINSPKDIQTVLDVMNSLSESNEPVLRTDLMEQVPQIAFLCHDHPDKLSGLITGTLVPMVVRFLTDSSDMVRKTSQAALLVLLEQELVSHNDVQNQVCPAILDLTEPDALDYFKIEAVALMSKMAPLVGREMTERFFMQRFTRLCSDTLFQVRKVCAANFGEFSGVIGTDRTENVLLPYFLNLCEDGIWGVRKACADVFMVVSCACSLETRKKRLAPLFIALLSDESRWVRLAAFQNLGPFISTFADPSVTGLQYNEGILYIGPSPEDSNQSKSLGADSTLIADLNQKNAESSVEQAADEPKEWSDLCLKNSIEIENSELNDKSSPSEITGKESFTSMSSHLSFEKGVSESENQTEKDNFGSIWSEAFNESDKSGPFFQSFDSSCSTNIFEPSSVEDSVTNSNPRSFSSMSLNDDPSFNELNYWRIPFPELDLDLDLLEGLQLENSDATPPPQFPRWESDETKENDCFSLEENEKDEFPSEEQTTGESFSTVSSTPGDDVQAELEALAASLAESIFCNDSNPQEAKLLENIEPEEKSPLKESLDFNFEQEKKTSSPEKCKLTYAEICAASLTSKPKSVVAATSNEMAVVSNSSGERQTLSSACDSNTENTSNSKLETNGTISSSEESDDESQLRFKNMKIVILRRCDYLNIGSTISPGNESNESVNTSKDLYSSWPAEKSWSYKDSQETPIGGNFNQDIIPTTLLEHYISMTDPMKAKTVDDEITRHCAYSLPAVALTLGRRYWSLLRETYETLAADMHWKVRRTLAFSIHELALILGEELAQKDLLPVFEEFIRDLDEVRIGVLKHLTPFLKMLPPPQRELFLPRLHEFLNSDNINNWRFRLELALQLAPISELFSPQECWTHIFPITFNLMADKVVQIRRTCFTVISQLARQLMTENGDHYLADLSGKLSDKFAKADTWKKRQSYVYVVGQLIRDSSLPVPVVCSLFLPTFLDLSRDKVPNIRLVIAKIINSSLMTEYFHTAEADNMREALLRLQNDPDRDVQYFASFPHSTEITETQDVSFY